MRWPIIVSEFEALRKIFHLVWLRSETSIMCSAMLVVVKSILAALYPLALKYVVD